MTERNSLSWSADQRRRLVEALTRRLEGACVGSRVEQRGSLARGDADIYSDIDLAWVVPDEEFEQMVAQLGEVLAGVREVASIRADPDFQRSRRRRLVYVRFAGVPLFWRLDLEVWAASAAFDHTVDVDNPDASGDQWSLAESAAMNAIAAIKAVRRGHVQLADDLLARGFVRLGTTDPGGPIHARVLQLTVEAARHEQRLAPLADDIRALANDLLHRE